MKNKTFWIGLLVVFVVMQVINYLVHEVLLTPMYEQLVSAFRSEADMNAHMHWMMISGFVMLVLFCYIFTFGYEDKGIMEGVRYGGLMGAFYSIPMALDQHVVYPIPLNLATIWAVTGVITFMIVGGVFAAIYRPQQ